jgi:hypothetical protein
MNLSGRRNIADPPGFTAECNVCHDMRESAIAELEPGIAAGAMPEVKNLDEIGVHADTIVDEDGGVYQLADTGASWDVTTDVWEPPQQIDVIQDRIAEAFRSGREVSPRIVEDFLKIR